MPHLIAGWSSPVARQAHNLKVVGSNPAPATKIKKPLVRVVFYFEWCGQIWSYEKVGSLQGSGGRKHAGEAFKAEEPQRQLKCNAETILPPQPVENKALRKNSKPFVLADLWICPTIVPIFLIVINYNKLPFIKLYLRSFMFKLGIDISIKYIVDLFRQVSFLV